jgi:hypothetical protein
MPYECGIFDEYRSVDGVYILSIFFIFSGKF